MMFDSYVTSTLRPDAYLTMGTIIFVIVPLLLLGDASRKDHKWQSRLGLSGIPVQLFRFAVAAWLVIVALLFFGLAKAIWDLIWYPTFGSHAELKNWSFNFSLAGLAALTATTGAVVALPVTLNRLKLTRKSNELAVQGLITDRLNAAISSLSTDKRVNKEGEDHSFPNIEVRYGSLLSLKKLHEQKHPAFDQQQFIRLIRTYLYENLPIPSQMKDISSTTRPLLRSDLMLAFELLEQGSANNEEFKSSLDLQGLIFPAGHTILNLRIRKALLNASNFSECSFTYCRFSELDFTGCDWQDVLVSNTSFSACFFSGSDLKFAIVERKVAMDRCCLFEGNFGDGIPNAFQISNSFADISTTLPDGVERPKHWPASKLDRGELKSEWRKWLDDPESYTPPPPPEDDTS